MARTDAELIRASRRDARPFRELYDRYAEAVESFHRRRSRHGEAALDLTAETFARVWERRSAFRDEAGGSAAPWLFAIARNVLAESVRKGRIEQAASERLQLERVPSGVEPEESWLEAFAELPEGQREAIELRLLGDLDYEHVARVLDTTPQAARVRVSRGLATLRNFLTRTEAA